MKKLLLNSLFLAGTLLAAIAISSTSATAQQRPHPVINLGFTLTTFATLNPGLQGCCGPFGVAIAAPDRVLVFNLYNNIRYVFHDADGQTEQTAITSTTQAPSGVWRTATAGGLAYGGIQGGQFNQYNVDGTVNHYLTGVTVSAKNGMWGNSTNQHILATSNVPSIIDIDPTANGGIGSFRTVTSGGFDGIAVSPDGTVVYGESDNNHHILGYNIATGTQVYDSGSLSGANLGNPDGTGVISSNNNLNGMIIVNFNGNGTNTGGVALLDPTTNQLTVIANNGTRGDYAAPDTNNGTSSSITPTRCIASPAVRIASIGQGVGPCALPVRVPGAAVTRVHR